MRVSSYTNYPHYQNHQNLSHKSKFSGKKTRIKLPEEFKMKNLNWNTIKENAKKNLPFTLMAIGLVIPVPFASVLGFVIGTIVVKFKSFLKFIKK